jgi:uncharacterized protein (DUF58 family)
MLFGQRIAPAHAQELVAVTLKTLVDLAKPALALNLRKASIRSLQSGGYVSRFKGRGMEFDEARLYQPGDDIRSIDWRVTARTGKPHTKLFREERERPVFISVDNRPAMHFATRGVFKSVLAAKLAGLLAWTAQQHGDRIGGQIFSEAECRELKPQNGKHAVLRFFNALVRPVQELGSSFSLEHVLARLVQHARPGSRVYIISDFRGINEKAEQHLARLSQHCDVILIMVYDALEKTLPDTGRYRFTDDVRDVVIDSTDRQRLLKYQQRFACHQQHLQTLAKKMGMAFIQCSTTDDPIQRLRNAS